MKYLYSAGIKPLHTTIHIQPYDKSSSKEAIQLQKELSEHLATMLDADFDIVVLPEKELPEEFLSQGRKNYYRAEKIIKSLQTTPYDNITTIALTQDRICTSYKGHPNWSVHGLSIGNACVITTSHLGTKNKLWKVVVHEFIHTFYDYPHCPKDDPTCIMRDAKGHADMSNKNGLCHYCDSVINKR